MMAAMPVVDPSAAILKVVPGCCALNSSANWGTSFAPSVSDPLIISVSARVRQTAAPRMTRVSRIFFIYERGEWLLDWHESDAAWILTDFGRDLFVSSHLLRALGVIALLHRQFLELRVCAGRGVAGVDRDFPA